MAVLVVSTDAGDFAIQENEVSTITAAELCQTAHLAGGPSQAVC
jgi:hypothetical protein